MVSWRHNVVDCLFVDHKNKMEEDCKFMTDNMYCSFISLQLSYHVLQIQLEDRNDNPPTFQNIPYSITISEVCSMFCLTLV